MSPVNRGSVMVLETVGRRAGRRRFAPVLPIDGGEDRRCELAGTSELRPVPGRQVYELDVLDPGQLGDIGMPCSHPAAQRLGRELAGDDGDGHVVSTVVVQHLLVARDAEGLWN